MHDSRDPLRLFPETLWQGDTTLLTWPSAAVLDSRQSKYPVGNEPWVRSTIGAATEVAREGIALISGIDMKTWELGLWAAGEALGGIIVLAGMAEGSDTHAVEKRSQQILREFTLSHQAALVVPYEENPRFPKRQWKARDLWILRHAQTLYPVSIRPGGFFEEVLARNEFSGKTDLRFRVDYAPRRHSFPPRPKAEAVRSRLGEGDWSNWSVHWTRTQHSPWPGERARSFYGDLAASGSSYVRSALATLKRIVQEKRLRGSGRHMPYQKPMLGFSELHPADALELMRWRRRYVQPAYEPYGVAVRTEALIDHGARRVLYGRAEEGRTLPITDRLYFQTMTSGKADWSAEKEVRISGDLDLAKLNEDDVRVIVRSEKEMDAFSGLPWNMIALSS